jgi:ribosomal protein S16
VVARRYADLTDKFIEDIGSIDPMPNRDNQILVALNIDRIKHYLARSVSFNAQVGQILGTLFIIDDAMISLFFDLFLMYIFRN